VAAASSKNSVAGNNQRDQYVRFLARGGELGIGNLAKLPIV